MSGMITNNDAHILFDPGAESNIISDAYVKRYDIPVHENKNACNGVMADGTVKQLLHIVMNISSEIQSYKGTADAYVMPIATYDMILGVLHIITSVKYIYIMIISNTY